MNFLSLASPCCHLLLVLVSGTVLAAAPVTSALWGERGEKWEAQGRLPDFSYAGYHRGEAPIPDLAPAANVKDFGAVGDGVADDTKAIQAAIDATKTSSSRESCSPPRSIGW